MILIVKVSNEPLEIINKSTVEHIEVIEIKVVVAKRHVITEYLPMQHVYSSLGYCSGSNLDCLLIGDCYFKCDHLPTFAILCEKVRVFLNQVERADILLDRGPAPDDPSACQY